MRIVKTEKTVFTFNELSDSAKEKARQWYRECLAGDSDFAEFVFEDAANIAELIGLDIRQRRVKLMNGDYRYEPSIYYSGFSSQGDGACFEGSYRYKPGALKAVKGYAPLDTRLHAIARDLQLAQKPVFYTGTASTSHSGHYYHSGCMRVSADVDSRFSGKLACEFEEAAKEALRDFADWIYRQLENVWDYLNSDEHIDDSILCNEYEFDEDGERV